MKKTLILSLMFLLIFSVTACSDDSHQANDPNSEQSGNNDNEGDIPLPNGNGRNLVIFTSRTGNTDGMAQTIKTELNCDILEVVPTVPYDTDYSVMSQRAHEEQAAIEQGRYPSINTSVNDFDQYDVIFVGYPIWHDHMSSTMQTFLHNHGNKLKGKRIVLFASSGSTGINTSVDEASELCHESTFLEPFLLTSSTVGQMSTRIPAWLEQLGIKPETSNNNENNLRMINIIVGNQTLTATMEDNVAARDFLSRLPLEVTLNDYANTEKIFYPTPALDINNVPRGCTPVPGDITIFAPWGNVAIFYKSFSSSNSLIKIGHIDGDGINALNTSGDIKVKFERK